VAIRIVQPSSGRPILNEGGAPAAQFNTWLKLITERTLIIGTGLPESITEAAQGALYLDQAGVAGNLLYVKRDADIGGDKTKGWILV